MKLYKDDSYMAMFPVRWEKSLPGEEWTKLDLGLYELSTFGRLCDIRTGLILEWNEEGCMAIFAHGGICHVNAMELIRDTFGHDKKLYYKVRERFLYNFMKENECQ